MLKANWPFPAEWCIMTRLRVLASMYLNNLEQSVSVKAVSIINFGLGGGAV